MGLNFFSRVFSFDSVPELRRSEYLDSKVCSSSSDHFLRFIFVLGADFSWIFLMRIEGISEMKSGGEIRNGVGGGLQISDTKIAGHFLNSYRCLPFLTFDLMLL